MLRWCVVAKALDTPNLSLVVTFVVAAEGNRRQEIVYGSKIVGEQIAAMARAAQGTATANS